jgi:N-acetylglucosamine-6-phosphate deacetylase
MRTLLLRNARVVMPDGLEEATSILIEDGRLADVTSEDKYLPAGESIDLSRLTLFPGFIDIHIHGAVGVDTMQADAPALRRVSEFLTTQGVTAWLPTLVPGPVSDYQRAIDAIEETSTSRQGSRILGVHYEGPFVNSAQCGALRKQFFRTFNSPADLDDLPVLRGANAKHMITVAPEVDGGIDLISELTRRGWIVSAGHTRADFELLNQAAAAGARHMTHFMNAMSPMHHRSPGPIAWGLLRDDVSCDMIADGIHLDPQMLGVLMKLKAPERLTLISDAIAAAGQGDGEYQIWGETIRVTGGKTRNAAGSIAGSVISMLDAVRLMKKVGASDVALACMASLNPARLLGIQNDYGSIAVGKKADLVALDDHGDVVMTFINGEVAHRRP